MKDKLVYSVDTSQGIIIFIVTKVQDLKPLMDKANLDGVESWVPSAEYPFQDVNTIVQEIINRGDWKSKLD